MLIEENIITEHGGLVKKYKKGEFVFHEGDVARCYYQIVEGNVKMYNVNHDGKEFMQGVFTDGACFGEPPLFINEGYPATAMAMTDSLIFRLSKENFFKILDKHPKIQREMLYVFAERIYNKAITAKEIINHSPESRILGFLTTYKKRNCNEEERIQIPYTRQDIANFTGLRVETVIRTLSKMKDSNKVEIVNRKLLF
jgi:CRP-like cAMP-binding protein